MAGNIPTPSSPIAPITLVMTQSTDAELQCTCNRDNQRNKLPAEQMVTGTLQHADSGSDSDTDSTRYQGKISHAETSTLRSPSVAAPTAPLTEADLLCNRQCPYCLSDFKSGDEIMCLNGQKCHNECVKGLHF